MIHAKVVDASALAAVLFAEPEGIKVKALIGEADLLAPTLLPYELASVCLKKIQRHPQVAALLRSQLSLFSALEIALYPVDQDEILDEEPAVHANEMALLSEAALAVGWNRPEEDTAWSHLPQAVAALLPGSPSDSRIWISSHGT